MATQILANPSSHFSQGSDIYSSDVYSDYSSYQSFTPNNQSPYLFHNEEDQLPYAGSQSWTNQQSLRRISSRSPSSNNIERTPIRHHKSSISRARSTSRPEALLAYVAEPTSQLSQPSANTTPSLQQSPPTTNPSLFSAQQYSSMPSTSPFVHQPGYYDNTTSQFNDIPTQAPGQVVPDYFPMNRADMHVPNLSNAALASNEAMYSQNHGQSRAASMSTMTSSQMGFPPIPRPLESTPGNIEISSSRNKPQCWDHGCNGRQFSTFSNLLRHQREKSGTAAKARCPHCGTEFTRTTARNGHMYGGKCKGVPGGPKRNSTDGSDGNLEE